MRIVERSPDQRGLPQLLIPQEPRRLMPSDVAEEIVLTHPVQPPTASFLESLFRNQVVGAATVTTVDLLTAPADQYFYVLACACFHNDTVTRRITILVGSSAIGYTELRDTNSRGGGDSLAVLRPFLVPAGLNVRFTLDALAATFVLTGRMTYVNLLLAENHPSL